MVKSILITGGMGLIGHNVAMKLEALGHNIVIVDNRTNYGMIPQDELDYLMHERQSKIITQRIYPYDIVNPVAMRDTIKMYDPEIVIHLASFPRQKVVNKDPCWGSRIMSEGLLNLLERSVQNNVKKFVYVSSSMVYGDFDDQVTEDAVCNPQGQYGIMKLAGEWLVKDYTRKHGLKHTIIRPSAVYGPLDVEDRVVSKFLLTAMRDGTLRVNGAHETLDFTYVDDAADGIVEAALRDAADNETFNITKSHSWTLLDAAELAVSIAGRGTIQVQDKDSDFPSRGSLNISKARRLLGYDPKVDIEQGFENYYQWLSKSSYWNTHLSK